MAFFIYNYYLIRERERERERDRVLKVKIILKIFISSKDHFILIGSETYS